MIPIALAGAGFFVSGVLQSRETQEKRFETAVTVLQSNSSSTPELRKWALTVFHEVTDARITELSNSPLPAGVPCGPNNAGHMTALGTCQF